MRKMKQQKCNSRNKSGSEKVVIKEENYVFAGTNRKWLKNRKCKKVKSKLKGVFFSVWKNFENG